MSLLDLAKSVLTGKITEAHAADRALKTETFSVVGIHYCMDSIGKLAYKNQDWKLTGKQAVSKGKAGQKIFRYYYTNKPVKLVLEPKNPHDKNAVMVRIAGEKVGYIGKDENLHVRDIMKKYEIKYISGFISGGTYKVAAENGTFATMEENIRIKIKIGYV